MIFLVLVVSASGLFFVAAWIFHRWYYIPRIRPTKLKITQLPTGIVIRYRWIYSRHYVWIVVDLVYLASIISVWIVSSARDEAMGCIGPLSVLLVLVMAYSTVAGFLNKTEVYVDRHGNLRVVHGPLPSLQDPMRNLGNVGAVFYRKEAYGEKLGPWTVYPVYARLASGREFRLISEVEQEEHAQEIVRIVQDWLQNRSLTRAESTHPGSQRAAIHLRTSA